jgi:hypothetical protein
MKMNFSRGLEASPGAWMSFIKVENKAETFFTSENCSIFGPKSWYVKN